MDSPDAPAQRISILIVDDSAETQQLFKMQIEAIPGWHPSVAVAKNGEEGLARLKDGLFDLVFLDYLLPGADGLEILGRIRQHFPQLAVVMLTGAGSERVAVEAMAKGAMHYLTRSEVSVSDLEFIFGRVMEMKALSRENEDLKVASETRERFLANISHEMRTPLAVILGYAETLKDGVFGPLNDDQRKAVHGIIARASDLKSSLGRILRLKDGAEEPLAPRDVELRALVAARVAEASSQAATKNITVHWEAPKEEIWLRGDGERLAEVVDAFLSNAVRFSKAGSSVEVDLSRQGAEVVVCVSDHGPGISQEMLPRVFEEFGAAKVRGMTKGGGLGLGLPLAKRIVERHEGRIWLESSPGRGTRACAAFPSIAAPAADRRPTAPITSEKRVLIVEDHPEMGGILMLVISTLGPGLDFEIVRTAAEAERVLQGKKPDLMVLDLLLPGMDGLGILDRIRRMDSLRRPAVLVLTGHAESAAKAQALGPDAVLMKPVSKKLLLDTAERLLKR